MSEKALCKLSTLIAIIERIKKSRRWARRMRFFLTRAIIAAVIVHVIIIGGSRDARAGLFSFTGNLTQDSDVQLFQFSIGGASKVTLQTFSYAGGADASGAVIAAGGFEPILALFDSSGALLNQNHNSLSDAFLSTTLAADVYTVAIMEYDNLAKGPDLSDGFLREGQGDFTGPEFLGASGKFIDSAGNQRNGTWEVDILNVDSASLQSPQAVPAPSTLILASILLGMFGLVWSYKGLSRSARFECRQSPNKDRDLLAISVAFDMLGYVRWLLRDRSGPG